MFACFGSLLCLPVGSLSLEDSWTVEFLQVVILEVCLVG